MKWLLFDEIHIGIDVLSTITPAQTKFIQRLLEKSALKRDLRRLISQRLSRRTDPRLVRVRISR